MATVFFSFPASRTLAMASALVFSLAACSFGPNGEPPAMPQPAHYGAEAQPLQTVAAQGIAQQFVVGAKPVPEWWTLYRCDALNALVDEGLRNSPTLAATDRSLAAAREQLDLELGDLVASFLGEGDWQPKPETWSEIRKKMKDEPDAPDEEDLVVES